MNIGKLFTLCIPGICSGVITYSMTKNYGYTILLSLIGILVILILMIRAQNKYLKSELMLFEEEQKLRRGELIKRL